MSYFFFSGDSIITYNDKISIQYPFKTDFSLFVNANDLYKIVSKLTADILSIEEKDGKLNIKCKSLNANLATIKDEEINERITNVQKSLVNEKWKTLPNNFCEGISLCAFTASKQESDQTLTCIHINDVNCIASDNMRISHALLDSPVDPMFIKASEVKNLIVLEPIKYFITKSWLHFKNEEGCIFSIRKVFGKFPDFLKFFKFKGVEISFPKEIIEGMDITSIFADDIQPTVKIIIEKEFCKISVKSESGSAQYRTKIKYSGKPITFSINPEFLKQMMTYSSSIIVKNDKARLETNNFALVTALYN